jgi:hypothetical protein
MGVGKYSYETGVATGVVKPVGSGVSNPAGVGHQGPTLSLEGGYFLLTEDKRQIIVQPQPHPDGIKIGCTLITHEAFDKLREWKP